MNRRQLLQLIPQGYVLLLIPTISTAQSPSSIVAIRIWPAKEYTRVTLESNHALRATHAFIQSPPRLAIDVQGLEMDDQLKDIASKLRHDDPYISGVRAAQFAPNVVRIVLDLKQSIKPQVFSLQPIATYQHRTIFDIYPTQTVSLANEDPIIALINSKNKTVSRQEVAKHTSSDPLGQLIEKQLGQSPTPNTQIQQNKALPGNSVAQSNQNNLSLEKTNKTNGVHEKNIKTPYQATRIVVVAIDPGHGGEDPGAIGPSGLREKDVVLQIAKALRKQINDSANTQSRNYVLRAFLTREADYFIPLYDRVQKARDAQADLMVSIHADAFTSPHVAGSGVFALSNKGASSATARWLADKENAADRIGGLNINNKDKSLQTVLLDMSTSAQIQHSLSLGKTLLPHLGAIGTLHRGHVEQAGFAVLKAPDIPSVLVETAFISNPQEERKLSSTYYQTQMANAIYTGIVDFFNKNPSLIRTRTKI